MTRLPALSISTKLYALFALLAALTVALAVTAVVNARRHAALADDFQAAFMGAQNVQKVNSLIYAVVMESRGVYMSPDIPTAKKFGDGLLKFVDQIGKIVKEWHKVVHPPERGGAIRSILQAHCAIPGLPSRAGAARQRDQSGGRARMGRQ
jgi:hypothetical protein